MENKEEKVANKNEIKIKLSKVYYLDGKPVEELSMRVPPLVKDALFAAKVAGPNATQEDKDVAMVSNLCNVPLDFMENLDYKDYRVLVNAMKPFL